MKEIQRISITDAVVDNIKGLIESGEFQVGQKLPTEQALCEALKVSRTSVREAIRVLQALSYVKIIPGKGAFVDDYEHAKAMRANWYDVQDLKFYDYMEVRVAVETLAVRLSVIRASEKQVEELVQVHNSFVQANAQKDLVRLIMLDELYHTKIISYTQNLLLININRQLHETFRCYRSESFINSETYQNAVEPHESILNCFKVRDAQRAVREMQRHMDITTHDMERIMSGSSQHG